MSLLQPEFGLPQGRDERRFSVLRSARRRAIGARFDDETWARFPLGQDVDRKAQFAIPDGVLVDTGFDMHAAIACTKKSMAQPKRHPIFEATF
ncbi:hypothetical protein [Sphingomonas sp.]|uniref:hypothetical protein n=1 Tax=Sphingomonas sp. TaxID=28214 RepID=UPI001ECBE3F9|nr:hypothetical protein [Sphingomonas sp.]MBX3595857.1 hypothetical protein [Sphingomonas sp.]